MIKLLKNKEVRKALLWQLLLSAAACAVCVFFDIRAWLTAIGLSLLLMLVFCISTYKRYQRISSLADDINQVLHGDSSIDFDSYSEGELSILHSEIYKMTIRLREQQQTLTREKAHLADSIADISHQIRTPLTSINLLIGLLSEPKLTDARRQQLIHELYELLSRIDWLITTLLKISRLDAGTVQFKQEQVSLEELLKKSCVTLLIPMELRGQALLIHADGAFRGDFSWSCEAIGNEDMPLHPLGARRRVGGRQSENQKRNAHDPAAAQYTPRAEGAAQDGADRVDLPEPAGAGEADSTQRGVPSAEGDPQGRRSAGHSLP